MVKASRVMFVVALAVSCALLVNCGGGEKKPEMPEWCNTPSAGAAVVKDGDKYWFTTGIAPVQGSVYLARTSAANRGRVELASRLNLWVGSLWKDYAGTHPDLGEGAKEMTEVASKLVTDADLVGSQAFTYWEDKEGKVLYALVGLNLDDTVNMAKKKMEEAAKQHLKERYNSMQGDLDKEIDRRKDKLLNK